MPVKVCSMCKDLCVHTCVEYLTLVCHYQCTVNACVVDNDKSQSSTGINVSSSQFVYSASKTIYKNHILSKHIQSVIANIN